MKIRTSVEADLDQILTAMSEKSINTAHRDRYIEFLANGEYRPEFTWVAEDGAGRILGVSVWWSFPGADRPIALDGLFAGPGVADPVPMWTELVQQVTLHAPAEEEPPGYHIFLSPDWCSDADVQAALTPRLAAAAGAGATGSSRYAWWSARRRRPPPSQTRDGAAADRSGPVGIGQEIVQVSPALSSALSCSSGVPVRPA